MDVGADGRRCSLWSANNRKKIRSYAGIKSGKFTGESVDVCAIGNDMSVVTKDVEGMMWKGYKVWVCVPDADTWKIRVEYVK